MYCKSKLLAPSPFKVQASNSLGGLPHTTAPAHFLHLQGLCQGNGNRIWLAAFSLGSWGDLRAMGARRHQASKEVFQSPELAVGPYTADLHFSPVLPGELAGELVQHCPTLPPCCPQVQASCLLAPVLF